MIVRSVVLLLALLPAADNGFFAALRDVDRRMATIGWRLATANVALCDRRAPTPGWAIHTLGQYDPAQRAAARAAFGFAAPVAIEALVPGAAAAGAGLAEDDALLAVDDAPFPAGDPVAASATERDAVLALVADRPADAPLRLSILRGGRRIAVTVPASPGCRSQFEVLLGPKMEASSDGAIVQIGVRFFERYGDAQVAAVVAHELAHTILRHRDRLDAAGVGRGLLAEVGRNGRLFRRTETDADLLSVHLLRNAGYDPAQAVRFWREHGGDVDGGLFRSRTHPSSRARAQAIEAEIARIPANAPRPYAPPVLASRDAALD